MSFQDIKPIEDANFYLNRAFGRANKKAKSLKLKGDKLVRARKKEQIKIDIVKNILASDMDAIIKSFPSVMHLTDFYRELIEITIGIRDLRKSLAALNWAKKKILDFSKNYIKKIRYSNNLEYISKTKNEFYGRTSSFIKQIKSDFKFLEQSRKIMKNFPVIKKMPTTAITGFPNVGKTTLLTKLSKSKPEIKQYPFTTKSIMIGYLEHNKKKIQLLDTPGTLNRLNKMNMIEKIAFLALKHAADSIVYVFDLTEPFPLKDQEKLLKRIKEFKKPIVIYLSKTDILKKEQIENFRKKYKVITDAEELKKIISQFP